MATVRTQREIRQRAPIWLVALLFANLVIMAVDARDSNGKQKVLRIWTQTFASPIQSASSKASGATSGFFRQIFNFQSIARENEDLKQRLSAAEQQIHTAQQQAAENERLKALLNVKEQNQYQTVTAELSQEILQFGSIRSLLTPAAVQVSLSTCLSFPEPESLVVITVSPWASQVMLLTDEKAEPAPSLANSVSRSARFVRGRPDLGLIEMRYVSG